MRRRLWHRLDWWLYDHSRLYRRYVVAKRVMR
jgi:hypothetical protein